MNIVTCSDKNYIPGVIALYNSLKKVHGSDYDFHLLADGNPEDFKVFEGTDVNVLFNQSLDKNPKGGSLSPSLALTARTIIGTESKLPEITLGLASSGRTEPRSLSTSLSF